MATPAVTQPTIVTRAAPTTRLAAIGADRVAYALVLGGVYLLMGTLWFMSAKEKLLDGTGTPAGITKEFSGTFISSVPGTGAAWVLLGLVEAVAFLLFVASLVRGEFLPHRAKPLLLTGIATSMATFALLAFGDTVAGQFDGTASLFTYFAATGIIMFLVLLMPPYRPVAWLSSLVPHADPAAPAPRTED
jgi:hypothetical protein